MNRRLTIVVAILVAASAPLLAAPRPAYAQSLGATAAIIIGGNGTIQETLSAVANAVTGQATLLSQIKGFTLDPLAHLLAQAVLKSITASVVDSINGRNGSPQFVTNLSVNLQQVGDRVGLSFITQFGSSINSPFASAISSSLRSNYLQQTSLAGFFAANQCTLSNASPNVNQFLAGDWSQGGAAAWLSLTTQDQNNPYTLYQIALDKRNALVSSAQAKQSQVIAENNGFLSWCSSGSPDTSGSGLGASCSDFTNSSDCNGNFVCVQSPGKATGVCQLPTAATSDDSASTCYNQDGTPGTVETPGSVIHDSLSKVLGSGVDSLVSVHDFNQMVDTILSALVSNVVSSGLSTLSSAGSGGSGAGSGSYTSQLANSTDSNAAPIGAQAVGIAEQALARIASYTTAWQSLQTAANTASANLQALSNACPAESGAAQSALQNEVAPVLTNAQAALSSAGTTKTLALRVETESSATSAGSAGALSADLQALATAPPTTSDVATAQSNAVQSNAATSTPPGSLSVSGSSLIDQMALIAENAQKLQAACAAPPAL